MGAATAIGLGLTIASTTGSFVQSATAAKQRDKAERDAERHATEFARMTNIEESVIQTKAEVAQHSSRLELLEDDVNFKDKLVSKLTKVVALSASGAGLIYTIFRII